MTRGIQAFHLRPRLRLWGSGPSSASISRAWMQRRLVFRVRVIPHTMTWAQASCPTHQKRRQGHQARNPRRIIRCCPHRRHQRPPAPRLRRTAFSRLLLRLHHRHPSLSLCPRTPAPSSIPAVICLPLPAFRPSSSSRRRRQPASRADAYQVLCLLSICLVPWVPRQHMLADLSCMPGAPEQNLTT